jgi:hypothetical protein
MDLPDGKIIVGIISKTDHLLFSEQRTHNELVKIPYIAETTAGGVQYEAQLATCGRMDPTVNLTSWNNGY